MVRIIGRNFWKISSFIKVFFVFCECVVLIDNWNFEIVDYKFEKFFGEDSVIVKFDFIRLVKNCLLIDNGFIRIDNKVFVGVIVFIERNY